MGVGAGVEKGEVSKRRGASVALTLGLKPSEGPDERQPIRAELDQSPPQQEPYYTAFHIAPLFVLAARSRCCFYTAA